MANGMKKSIAAAGKRENEVPVGPVIDVRSLGLHRVYHVHEARGDQRDYPEREEGMCLGFLNLFSQKAKEDLAGSLTRQQRLHDL
jgi:hypothetical protein